MWGYDWEEAWTPWDGLVPSPTRPRLTHVCVNWCVQGRRLFFYLPAAASVIFFCGSIPVYHLKLNGPTTKISRVTPTKPNGKGKIRGKKTYMETGRVWPEVNGGWLHVVDDRHGNWLLGKRFLHLFSWFLLLQNFLLQRTIIVLLLRSFLNREIWRYFTQ